jgi:Ca2+-binding EF-hand superfamily protein
MVDAVATAIDTNSDGSIARQELKAYIRMVARIRIVVEASHIIPDLEKNAKYDMLHGDLDRDGLDLNEVFHMHHHDNPYDASIHPTDVGFTFCDLNGDGKVSNSSSFHPIPNLRRILPGAPCSSIWRSTRSTAI